MIILTENYNFGPYLRVEEQADRLHCIITEAVPEIEGVDDAPAVPGIPERADDLPLSAIGIWTLSGDDSLATLLPVPATIVPHEVTRRQGLQALYIRKRITEEMIQAQIDAIADLDQRYLASVDFRASQVFQRVNPLVSIIGAALAMTSGEMDDLFIFANTL